MPRRQSHARLFVNDHPVIQHMLAEVRDRETRPPRFRQLMTQIGALLAYEALRDLPTAKVKVATPMETFACPVVKAKVAIVPILRAGLGLAQGMMDLLPEAQIGHIGLFRDEQSLRPVSYYESLPSNSTDVVLLVDPMLATGGSAVAAIKLLHAHGCGDIRLVCLVAAPEGVKRLHEHYPKVPIHTAALDRELNDKGYILPGLGDAGDRLFGTAK